MGFPIAADSLYEIVLYGRYLGQVETRNTFSYRQQFLDPSTGTNNDLVHVPSSFWSHVITSMRAAVSTSQLFYQVEAKLIDIATGDSIASEFYPIPTAEQAGQVTGDALPPFVSLTFQYVRPNSDFRHGYVRIPGVAETFNVNGALGAGASGATQTANLASALSQGIGVKLLGSVDLDAGEMKPVLVQAQKNGDLVRPLRTVFPASVRFSKIGSQNSRKFGVGS